MDEIEEIKKRINIVELISGYVPLKKAGANYKGLCPFHNEDTPSFMVSEEKQIWKCFGCGEGGDAFTFIEKMEGLEFADALKLLADRAGVKLKRQNIKAGQEKVKLSDINEAAANFYHQVLLHPKAGIKALAYLKNRGIKLQTIKDFQIGYAPNQWEATYSALTKKKNYKAEDIERAGLIIHSEKKMSSNPYYDRFRGRIMFPIRNIAGTVVGFSGRVLDPDAKEAKYLNTPETPIFNKSEIIYGLDRARSTIRQKNFVVIVEGQMDVVSAHQAGFDFVVATSGTALTRAHIEVLKKYTENIAFCFDTDSAGTSAAKRAIDVANEAGVNSKLVILPAGEDPDSIIKKDKTKFVEAIKSAKNAMDFYFMAAFENHKGDLSIEDKRTITQELLPQIKKISDPVIQGEYLQKLSVKIETDEKYLREALEKMPEEKTFTRTAGPASTSPVKKDSLEQRIISIVLGYPKMIENFAETLRVSDFTEEEAIEIYKKAKELYNKNRQLDVEKLKKNLPAELGGRVDIFVLEAQGEFSDSEEKDIFEELGILIAKLKSIETGKIKQQFESEIKKAESSGDKAKVKELIKSFQEKIIEKGR